MKESTEFRIFLLLGALVMISILMGIDTQVVGEQLCVDGNQNINLEEIMCEKSETTWFGFHEGFAFLTLIPYVLFGMWIMFKD